jgi:hypothetical protein
MYVQAVNIYRFRFKQLLCLLATSVPTLYGSNDCVIDEMEWILKMMFVVKSLYYRELTGGAEEDLKNNSG